MEVIILDTNFRQISIIDTFESLIWTDRYAEAGDFEIYTSANTEMFNILRQDYYIYNKESDHLMIIEEIEIDNDIETGNHLLIRGRSLESILERRIIWSQTILDGGLQDGIKKLINENVINPSNPDRAISNFVFKETDDTSITDLTITAQYTGDNLYDAIVEICDAFKIGFQIILNDDHEFEFSLYNGINRSYDQTTNPYVIFSPNFENIINSNYLESMKLYKNVTLVAGEGEGYDRKTVTVGTGSGLERRELYTDARDISSTVDGRTLSPTEYNDQLTQRGTEKLAECFVVKTFEGEVEATQLFVYGRDFFLGDIVQVVNEYGIESKSRVKEMVYSQDNNGLSIYPTFNIINENEEDNNES